MAEPEIRLQVGDAVQIQLFSDQNNTRYLVKVIGYVPGLSLIVHTPRARGNPLLLRESQLLLLRLLSGNMVYAFETDILRVCTRPYPYLHLAYPRDFEQATIRKAYRASVQVFASLANDTLASGPQGRVPGVIIDLSVAGALIRVDQACGEIGDNLTVSVKLLVAGSEKYIHIPAVIRRIRSEQHPDKPGQRVYCHGVEFILVESEEQLVLHGFVFEQLAMQRGR